LNDILESLACEVNRNEKQGRMSLARAREFLLGAYHDLPNVLFIGSLILGSLTGYLSLIWVALGLILNGSAISIVQGLMTLMFPNWAQVSVASGSLSCEVIRSNTGRETTVVAPSHWLAATVFFAAFVIYNSIRVAIRPPEAGVAQEKIDTRRALSLSVFVVGIVFFLLVLARGFSGCETWLGGSLGILMGGGIAIGYWHLLDACNSGIIPDILQVVGSMAPARSNDTTPILCTPPNA
jgi:hypothetical protein